MSAMGDGGGRRIHNAHTFDSELQHCCSERAFVLVQKGVILTNSAVRLHLAIATSWLLYNATKKANLLSRSHESISITIWLQEGACFISVAGQRRLRNYEYEKVGSVTRIYC